MLLPLLLLLARARVRLAPALAYTTQQLEFLLLFGLLLHLSIERIEPVTVVAVVAIVVAAAIS